MKRFCILFLILVALSTSTIMAQDGGGTIINLKGDSNTEQAAKLELIRVLQERLNKLTVSQLNARIIVSKGVVNYYKVGEIIQMQQSIYAYRSKYVGMAQKIENGNAGFSAHAGNGFTYKYIVQLNTALDKAKSIGDQLAVVLKSGQPILLPPLPTFSITGGSGGNEAKEITDRIQATLSAAGVNSQEDWDKLSQADRDALSQKIEELNKQFFEGLKKATAEGNKQVVSIVGNVVGSLFGVPNAGSMLVGLATGNVNALAGLVGSIVDNFQLPVDYYDSNTLKLTDSERLKIIDELHVRMSELYQQVSALGANLSSETNKRYNELSQPRNEAILYGPKK
ncbi:hypothetical protein [Nibrella viscosa]